MAVDRWSGGDAYDKYMGRWSRAVAARFVDGLAVAPGRRWVDVGCGTGALSAAILERAEPASLVGVDPSPDFVRLAGARLGDPRARFVVGDGAALPAEDASADVVVSGLVLNFIPDVGAALREAVRVAAPGATIAAYVWDYAGRMDLLSVFWKAAVDLDPAAAALDEAARFPLCAPEPLRHAFEAAGLDEVEVRALDEPTVFRDFDDYWTPFLSGVGPAPAYAMSLDEASRERLRERLRDTLPIAPDGGIPLAARAWVVRGRR